MRALHSARCSIGALRARVDQREELLVAESSAARASAGHAELSLRAALAEMKAREARALGDAGAQRARCAEVACVRACVRRSLTMAIDQRGCGPYCGRYLGAAARRPSGHAAMQRGAARCASQLERRLADADADRCKSREAAMLATAKAADSDALRAQYAESPRGPTARRCLPAWLSL